LIVVRIILFYYFEICHNAKDAERITQQRYILALLDTIG
jgi:hypothetical protein